MSNCLRWLLLVGYAATLACSSRPQATSASAVTTPSTAPTAVPAQSIPYVLPAWQYVTLSTSSICWGADAGSNDPKLWWALEACSTLDSMDRRLPTNCTMPCRLYTYADFGLNGCTAQTGPAFQFNNTQNEPGFLHSSPNRIASPYRLTLKRSGKCTNFRGTQPDVEYYQNLGNVPMQQNIYQTAWTNTNGRYGGIPEGWRGIMEDDVFTGYAPQIYGSSEYGNVWLWQQPTGAYAASQPWHTAVASFLNSMCPTGGRCIYTSFNGVGGGAAECEFVVGADCYGSKSYAQGFLNNAVNVGAICSHLTQGNVDGIIAERPLYGNGNVDGKWSYTASIAAAINTAISMATGACPGIKWIDFEQPSQAASIRSYMTGIQWLVPDQNTGIADEVVQWRLATGPSPASSTSPDVASFWPEYTVVPIGPEQPLTPYHYSGTAAHSALGCPTQGDKGGIVALVVTCDGRWPVWEMQYHHCYINRADVGPCAALVNSSTHAVKVTASMFPHDPIATYHWQFTFTGNELATVREGNQTISTGCVNRQYCDGTTLVNGLPFRGDGSDTIPGRSAIFIHT